ncbi:MAG: hypothetical protein GX876_13290, partial [Bacteroidales bacterium]|nr:hypothetical protein [Bacteroidales bacterium]
MKVFTKIAVVVLFVLGSCTTRLHTVAEYDDLYYLPSDQQYATVVRTQGKKKVVENTLRSEEYWDNIYAADTLVSGEYYDAIDYDDVIVSQGGNVNNYYYLDDYSYAGRLNRFYGNYFYPYWRDPFYYGLG